MNQIDKTIKVNIKNIGKLDNEEVHIGQFTVFAGPNNTGKSSVSKLMYSLFDGMNANHAQVYFNSLINPLRWSLDRMEAFGDTDKNSSLSLLDDEIRRAEDIVRSFSLDTSEKIEEQLPQILSSVKEMYRLYEIFQQDTKKSSKKKKRPSLEPASLVM